MVDGGLSAEEQLGNGHDLITLLQQPGDDVPQGFRRVKGGVVEKKVTSAEEVNSIAQLPSKDVMIARVLGSMNAPISNFVYALDAIRKQKEEATA